MGLLTVKQVAERLNASPSFVRKLLKSSRLRHHVLGQGQGGTRVSEEQLAEYLASTERGGVANAKPPPKKPARLRILSLE